MSVYVDDAIHPFGRMKMCHCWSDTLDELFSMVDQIGVAQRWLQRPDGAWAGGDKCYPADIRLKQGMNASWVHFDIAKGKRDEAIALGAIPSDRYACLAHTATLEILTGDPMLVKYGLATLDRVQRIRLLREPS